MRAESAPPPQAGIEELLRRWGMRRVPFSPEDKAGALFPARTHQELLLSLETTAALRGVLVLTGPPGAGKSSLIKSWMQGLEPKRYLPLLITHSSLSATGMLEMLLAKLGQRPGFRRSANLLALEKHLAEIDPLSLVLILDDAQNYPAQVLEEIRMLLGLGTRQRSAFALVLLGDEYLLGSLRLSVQRALFSRVSTAALLEPLLREEIAPYLNWHVQQAGLNREIFAQASIDLLAEASEGNPRILSLLAQAAWLAAARSGENSVEAPHLHTALRQIPAAKARILNP
jgi:type II secretory pathway predicted ATPase ExeA